MPTMANTEFKQSWSGEPLGHAQGRKPTGGGLGVLHSRTHQQRRNAASHQTASPTAAARQLRQELGSTARVIHEFVHTGPPCFSCALHGQSPPR
jgi:hypothetical protein